MNAGPYPESTDETAKTQRRQATNAREHAWVAPSLALDGEAGGSQALPAGVWSTEASSEPACGGEMYEFDYGGNALEIDACAQGHGYWLDGGEESRVRELIRQRARDLHRAATAESAFSGFLDQLRRQGRPRRLG